METYSSPPVTGKNSLKQNIYKKYKISGYLAPSQRKLFSINHFRLLRSSFWEFFHTNCSSSVHDTLIIPIFLMKWNHFSQYVMSWSSAPSSHSVHGGRVFFYFSSSVTLGYPQWFLLIRWNFFDWVFRLIGINDSE